MPAAPSVLKAIGAIRKLIASPPAKDASFELYAAMSALRQNSEKIAGDAETLAVVLALAPEIEAFRGKGSRSAARDFSRYISYLVDEVKYRLPRSGSTPDLFPDDNIPTPSEDVIRCLEMLAAHAFSRTQGPPVRSQHAGQLRAAAWEILAETCDLIRRPDHLAHALEVAGDARASTDERQAAIGFLISYWGSDDPDEATATLLRKLEENPPDRTFLVTVLQAQIELGLNDELGALSAVDDWDDAREED